MKEALTSFDIRVLLRDLSEIEGAYLDKVYQRDSSFILRFNLPRVGKRELFIEPGRWIFLGQDFEKPRTPPAFAQNLRKLLHNAVLQEVRQRGFDRILLMKFEKETGYTLVLEMFGTGNLILLRGEEILQALRPAKWRTRDVWRGQTYVFPPEAGNPTTLDFGDFREIVGAYEGPVVKVLALSLGLGGLYAEETCLRASVQKDDSAKNLGEEEMRALYEELRGLLKQLDEPAPAIVLDEGPVDVVPFPLQLYKSYRLKRFGTMSEALQEYVNSLREEVPKDEARAKIERRMGRQEEVLRDLKEEIELAGAATDYLYANYQEVDRLLRMGREGELREGLDPESGLLRLEVSGHQLELDIRLGVDENARLLYKRKKAAMDRVKRVRRALQESRRELGRVRTTTRRQERRPAYKPSKRFWFDAYRWSLTSKGFLILGGRDARSNEKLVRKHLEPGDRYFHADLPGAPSVVLKDGSKAGNGDLKETSRFALVFSKAWQLGIGSGSAYWVKPEQVSKTAESGQYLKTGSFVIRGRRNYHHNLALALAVGEVSYEEVKRVIAADPDAIEELSHKYVVLEPAGALERRSLVRQLSETFGVPPEEIERVLPAGTFTVRRVTGLSLDEIGN
ncbi:MAG: ribosome rescue protein RqcH [Thermoplasmata archaeon]